MSSPSALPWCAWLLGGCGAWVLGLVIYGHALEERDGLGIRFVYGFIAIGLFAFAIALVNFLKWVWD